MPFKKTAYKKKTAPRRKMGMRRRARPLKYNTQRVGGPNTCKIIETLPSVTILANTPYQIQVGGISALAPRATAVCEQFGLYRIANLTYKYKPNFDTYTSNPGGIGGDGPVTVPYLYWKMNRFADAPAGWALNDIKAMGAKPLRFDDKNLTVSYKPNILVNTDAAAGSNSGQVKVTPWLNTDKTADQDGFAPSDTAHYGHFYYVDCSMNGTGLTPVGTLEVTIVYEFKNPRVTWTPAGQGGIQSVDAFKSLLDAKQTLT